MTEQVLVVAGLDPGIGGMDSGCQGWLTAHAMKKYLGWDAKCLVFGESYLQYPTDWVFEQNVGAATVLEYAANCTYFIFMDSVVNIPQLPLGRYLTPNNHCILGVGSGLRNDISHVLIDQMMHGLVVVTAPQDESTTTRLTGVPFDFVIVDIDEIVELAKDIKKNTEFTICHAHTRPGSKSTDIIERLEADPDLADVKFDAIYGLSWEETIKRKAKAHCIIDDLVTSTYGLNVLEAMVLNQHVITNIGPWCYMIHPDLPIKSCSAYDDIKSCIMSHQLLSCNDASEWVCTHNHAYVVAEKWKHFVEWSHSR